MTYVDLQLEMLKVIAAVFRDLAEDPDPKPRLIELADGCERIATIAEELLADLDSNPLMDVGDALSRITNAIKETA